MMAMTESAKIDLIRQGLYDRKYVDIIDGLRPDSTFSFDPSEEPFLNLYVEDPTEFLELLKTCIFRVMSEKQGNLDMITSAYKDLRIKITTDRVSSMHEISSKHENVTITFDCQIIATDSPKTFVKTATFICPICGRDFNAKANHDRKIPIHNVFKLNKIS